MMEGPSRPDNLCLRQREQPPNRNVIVKLEIAASPR